MDGEDVERHPGTSFRSIYFIHSRLRGEIQLFESLVVPAANKYSKQRSRPAYSDWTPPHRIRRTSRYQCRTQDNTDKTHQCLATFLSGHRRNVGTLLSVSSGVQQLTASIMLPELMVSEMFRSIEHVSLCWSAKWSNQAQDCSQVVKPVKPTRVDYS